MASKVSGVIEKINVGGTEQAIASSAYGYCETAAGTAAKVVDMTDFKLYEGVTIHVKFKEKNSASSPTLNVNGTGAKNIVQYGTTAVGTTSETNGWYAGAVISFTYDGTNWVRDQGFNTNTTYYYESCYSSTAASTAAKVAQASSYTLPTTAGHFAFWLLNSNTAASKLTLAIKNGSTAGTAKDIWINGTVTSSTNYTWPSGFYIGYYDGSVYHFRTDGKLPGSITGDAATVNGLTVQTAVPANAVFTDTKSFTITANATDGYWDLTGTNGTNSVTYALAPYSSKQSGANFYTGTTNPDGTTRLNYNGYLYATKLYSGGTEVSVSGHTHNYIPLNTEGGIASCSGNGNYRYCTVATINTKAAYINGPMVLEVSGRGIPLTTLQIRFKNQEAVDPNLDIFISNYSNAFYIKKTNTNEWTIYCDTGGSWNSLVLHRITGAYSSRITPVMTQTLTALPEDCTQVSYGGNVATAISSSKATAANITTTANAVAYYTNTTGTFGSKASANGALYATSANGALSWGTLPIAQGGTGKTTADAAWTALGGGASGKHADSYFIKAVTSTDNAIVRFDGTNGQVQNSRVQINDNGLIIITHSTRWPGDVQLKNNSGTLVGEYWYDTGDDSKVTSGKYYWRQYSPKATADTATSGYYEEYSLPTVTAGLTESKGYSILTTKSTVAVTNGGTGKTSWTQWGVLYASSSTALANTGAGTSGYLLMSNASSAPSWVDWRKHIFANKNESRITLTVTNSSWDVTSGTDVFGLSFKDTGLTYTPSGGSATASSDTGDWRVWLTCAAASNTVQLNMRIDGTWQASKFIGPLQGNADTATKVKITSTSLPSSGSQTSYITFSSSTTTGNQDLKNADRLYIYENTSAIYLNVGKSTVMGGLTLHSATNTSAHGDLVPTTLTASTTRTWKLPNASGWVVIGGNGTTTGAGDTDTPVYLKADGTLATITSYDGNAASATKIAAKLATTTKTFLLGTSTTITGTAANVDLIGDTGVYLTTTAGQLSAKSYSVNNGTNEKVRMEWNATDQSLDFIFN